MDGIEQGLDKWLEGLWPALRAAVQLPSQDGAADGDVGDAAAASAGQAGAAADGDLKGVPPLPRCRVRVEWAAADAAAAVRAAEAAGPSAGELSARDPAGEYSAEAPFWAPVGAARYLTTELSDEDRQVGGCGEGVSAGLSKR